MTHAVFISLLESPVKKGLKPHERVPNEIKRASNTRWSGEKMKMRARVGLLLFGICILTGVRGETPKQRQNSWSTHVIFGIHPAPAPQTLNISTPMPGTEPGLIETPLPWPHPSSTKRLTEPGPPSAKTPTPALQGNTTSGTSSNNSSTTASSTATVSSTVGHTTATVSPTTANTSSWTIKPIGCYRDSYVKPRPLPELLSDFRDTIGREDTNKTIRECAEKARGRGFKVFGIQFYTECWSGTKAEETYGRDGVSVDCQNGVGKSGANFVYRFNDYELRCSSCERSRRLCFPAVSLVTLESGASISMRQLRLGDRVRTLGTNGEITYSEVIAFLHKETGTRANFYRLEVNGENAVTLSPQHLIFRKKDSSSSISAVFASDIKLEDLLSISNGSGSKFKAVTRITMVTEIGAYAPLTAQGTLLVDGVLVSCYANWPSHDTAHLAMAPLRAWKRLTGLIGRRLEASSREVDGISWYALALMALTDAFI